MKYLFLFLFYVVSGFAPDAMAAPVLPLTLAQTQVSSNGYLTWRPSREEAATPDAALSSAWQDLPGAISVGYRQEPVWLTLNVRREDDAPREWVLSFTNSLLDDIAVYRKDAFGQWTMQRSGENLERSRWAIDAKNVVLPLTLAGGTTETLLIRLQTKNSLSTEIVFWQREAYETYSRREAFAYGLYFGCYLLLILYHSFFWWMTKEQQSGWYLLYVTNNVAVELLTIALPQQFLNLPVEISDPLLGIVICTSLAIGAKFSLLQLELPSLWPVRSKLILSLGVTIALVGSLLVLNGRFGSGMALVQMAAMMLIAVFTASAVWLFFHKHRPARFYLLAFGIFYVGVIVSFLRNLAVVPPNFWTNHASIIGTMLHMLLMSLRLNRRYDVLRREKTEAQAAAVQAIRTLNEGLEREVESRTADLKQEIARRVILETELRAALEVERRTKEEQQDFVAMVSHEFRTPLSIINTTAQQVAKNPDAPWEKTLTRCQNLRDATERMSALVDEYLVVDRMDADASPFRPTACELDALLRDIVGEWPSDRVQLDVGRLPPRYTCDASLLRVALRNLIANAVRHTPSEKLIRVIAECSRELGLSIRVSNPGEAIPLDEVPRLFQKYFRGRLAQHRPGAGLGLYLTERIAQMHGGNVCVENAGADGVVTFSLTLPYQIDYALA